MHQWNVVLAPASTAANARLRRQVMPRVNAVLPLPRGRLALWITCPSHVVITGVPMPMSVLPRPAATRQLMSAAPSQREPVRPISIQSLADLLSVRTIASHVPTSSSIPRNVFLPLSSAMNSTLATTTGPAEPTALREISPSRRSILITVKRPAQRTTSAEVMNTPSRQVNASTTGKVACPILMRKKGPSRNPTRKGCSASGRFRRPTT
mmetsp:Transcript_6747/g.18828  ORF Transcript_6747/g.18828 Transcript_6747/m.18828 type:complete len:209 (+) Transcript_6747:346-972(+)